MMSFEEWKRDRQKRDEQTSKTILLVIVILALIAGLVSCTSTRNGYGCKGKSKLITRVPQ
jgi:hypothetical protein